jgi:hypothetical protein
MKSGRKKREIFKVEWKDWKKKKNERIKDY